MDKYEGDTKGGKKHGTGIFTDDVGNKGIGEFRDGEDWNTKIYDKTGNFFSRMSME